MHIYEKKSFFPVVLECINRILPFLFWIFLIFSFSDAGVAATTVLSALIHESGHVLYLFSIGKNRSRLRAVISGFRLKSGGTLSYKQEFLLYLSGPLSNLIAALLSLLFFRVLGEYSLVFAAVNTATALSNLLPIRSYDGYGIIKVLIERNDPTGMRVAILGYVSFGLISTLSLLSLYFMARYGSGYWIFAIFLISTVKELSKMLSRVKSEI